MNRPLALAAGAAMALTIHAILTDLRGDAGRGASPSPRGARS